jgi:WD40 repeat protein
MIEEDRHRIFSADRRFIAEINAGGGAVRDAASGDILFRLEGHAGSILGAYFSPNSAYLVTTSEDESAQIWSTRTHAENAVMRGHSGVIIDVFFLDGGRTIGTVSEDMTVRLWPYFASYIDLLKTAPRPSN